MAKTQHEMHLYGRMLAFFDVRLLPCSDLLPDLSNMNYVKSQPVYQNKFHYLSPLAFRWHLVEIIKFFRFFNQVFTVYILVTLFSKESLYFFVELLKDLTFQELNRFVRRLVRRRSCVFNSSFLNNVFDLDTFQ